MRLTSEPEIGAEFAKTSVASRKLRDNRRVWFKRLLDLEAIMFRIAYELSSILNIKGFAISIISSIFFMLSSSTAAHGPL